MKTLDWRFSLWAIGAGGDDIDSRKQEIGDLIESIHASCYDNAENDEAIGCKEMNVRRETGQSCTF